MQKFTQRIFDIHDIDCNQKYGGDLPYSFHLRAVLAQGKKFSKLFEEIGEKYISSLEGGEEIFFREYSSIMEACLAGHDLIEDGRHTYNDVKKLFDDYFYPKYSQMIADIIYDVTDEKGKTRSERKNDKFYKALKDNEIALFVKLADMAADRIFSKLFDNRQYRMYVGEFENFKQKTYSASLDEMFTYVGNI